MKARNRIGKRGDRWNHLLRPVLAEFVAAFDSPTTEENKTFWGKVCHRKGGGSGPTYLGGWLTAFCVFDEDGKWLGHKFQDGVAEVRSFVIAPIYIHFLYRQHRCKEQALPPRHLIFLPPTLKTQRLGAKTNKYPARDITLLTRTKSQQMHGCGCSR